MNKVDERTLLGVWMRVFPVDGFVQFLPEWIQTDPAVECWHYAVYKFAFVPGFHVCQIGRDFGDELDDEAVVLSSHRTLHEAMGITKILLANGGVEYA